MMICRHTGRDEGVLSLVIYAPRIDFDWAVFVEDNLNNRFLLTARREQSLRNKLMCRFEATTKQKKDTRPKT